MTRDRTDGGGQGDKGAGGWCISTQELSRQEPPPPRRPGLGLQDVPRPFGQHLPTTLCHSQAIWRLRSSPEGPHKPCPAGQAHLVWETPADESSPWRYLSPERGDTSPGPWGPACPEVASVHPSWKVGCLPEGQLGSTVGGSAPSSTESAQVPEEQGLRHRAPCPKSLMGPVSPITLRKCPRPSAWPVCLYLIPSTSIPIVVAFSQLCFCTCPGRLPKSGPLLLMENTSIQSSRASLTITS